VSDPFAEQGVPRVPLLGAWSLVAITLVVVALVRVTGAGPVVAPVAETVAARELRFEDRPEGGVAVYDSRNGVLIDMLAPGGDGFVRGALRSLARERRGHGIGAEPPVRLSAHADGRLTLEDPTTGRRIDLAAFGPTNSAAFARFLPRARAAALSLNHSPKD
jgi:putative photosynthetic complex assembly protein